MKKSKKYNLNSMIIKNIHLLSDNTHTTLSADLSFRDEKFQKMFFRVENKYKNFICADASPFLASLLLPCMKRQENIIIKGTVSRRLIITLPKIMEVVEKWDVGFKKISLKVDRTSKDTKKSKASGAFFSGGVDSFYTYLKNKKEVTHFVLIHGWDISLNNTTFLTYFLRKIKKLVRNEKLGLIIVESNHREIIEPVLEWEWNLGSALGAAGLFLRNGLKSIYIPSGMRWDQLCPYGTHPDLDPLWSTEKFKIIHDGCEYSRLEKICNSISKSTLALQYLRVCSHTLKNQYNCNRCFKCVQTKIELLCANVLHKAKTFDQTLTPSLIKKIYYKNNLNFNLFGEEALVYLKKQNKYPKLQEALIQSLQKSKKPTLLRRISDFIAFLDKKYNHRKLYAFIFRTTPNQDRTFLFKIIANMGLIR